MIFSCFVLLSICTDDRRLTIVNVNLLYRLGGHEFISQMIQKCSTDLEVKVTLS